MDLIYQGKKVRVWDLGNDICEVDFVNIDKIAKTIRVNRNEVVDVVEQEFNVLERNCKIIISRMKMKDKFAEFDKSDLENIKNIKF